MSAEGRPFSNNIKHLQWLTRRMAVTGAKGLFPAMANLIEAGFGGRP